MQIVIDIDENVFTRLFDNGIEDYEIVNDDLFAIAKSIRKGVSISKFLEERWIPVSERLPEENITVIGTTDIDDIYKTELYDDCGEKKWYANGIFDVPIIAWMPLPEPYKAESEKAYESI